MGIFSNLARQIVTVEDDDEAADIIRRNTGMPPPRPIDPTTLGQPPAPVLNFPPPTGRRATDNLGAPPAMPSAPATAPIRTMRGGLAPDYSQPPPPPTTVATMPPPARASITPEGVPEPIYTGPPLAMPPPPRVMVGESYKGMTPTQQSATRLRVLRSADPSSKVQDTGEAYEVLPPEKMSRKAGAGRGLLTLLTAGAPYGLGGMIGSGIFGAIYGAAAPGKIQELQRKMEIGEAQQEYGQNLALETEATQNDTRRLSNAATLARLQDADLDRALNLQREERLEFQQGLSNINELQKQLAHIDPASAQYAAAEKAIQDEAQRLANRTRRKVTVIPGNPRLNTLPRMEVDGQIIQQQYDGSWKPVFGTPRSADADDDADLKAEYEWQTKNTENEAKRTAAITEAGELERAARDHQEKVKQIATQISQLDNQMSGMFARDPALEPLKRQRQQLKEAQETEQKRMDDAYKAANEKKAEAQKYPTLPPPPKRARANKANPYAGQSLSKAQWLKTHNEADWQKAVDEANRLQIPIIP